MANSGPPGQESRLPKHGAGYRCRGHVAFNPLGQWSGGDLNGEDGERSDHSPCCRTEKTQLVGRERMHLLIIQADQDCGRVDNTGKTRKSFQSRDYTTRLHSPIFTFLPNKVG